MPRFFFDVREGASFLDDEEGLEFDTFDAAEREAAIAVASIARDRLLKDTRDVTIEMLNEHRQRVLTINSRMEVDRVEPPPVPSSGGEMRGHSVTLIKATGWDSRVSRPG